ncbi:DUF3040 domain-containing protein (plasmid) [Pseudonocardia bannensis]|uniref:DUF3040 domain-containing protein n=1 Tax=Pseudonocardia bannensis TaxID=630973 RepID=A0A848DR55_9PSEU|nr:DUF3040 domain-containing protein [Pseudonocardia bannensis]NMH94871.1 DUF3040 domain-containing protein [Pseudonocardia bannensis]
MLNDGERRRLEALEHQIRLGDPDLAAALHTMRLPPDGPTSWRAIAFVVIAPLVIELFIVTFGILATTMITAIAMCAIVGGPRPRQHNRDRSR